MHALGGMEMMRAAAGTAAPMRLVAVTVLTSHTPASYGAAIGRDGQPDVAAEVARLARQAMEAGLDGVVASPLEIGVVRSLVRSGGWIVVPGIRGPGDPTADQRRTVTPADAVRLGATHLVVGRHVTGAGDPSGVYQRLVESL